VVPRSRTTVRCFAFSLSSEYISDEHVAVDDDEAPAEDDDLGPAPGIAAVDDYAATEYVKIYSKAGSFKEVPINPYTSVDQAIATIIKKLNWPDKVCACCASSLGCDSSMLNLPCRHSSTATST